MEIPRTSYSRSCCFCFTLFPRFLCHTLSENAAGKRITNCNLSLQHYPSATTRNSRRALTGLKRWGCAQREDAHNIQVGSTLFNRLQVLVSSEWTRGSPSIFPLSIRRVSPSHSLSLPSSFCNSKFNARGEVCLCFSARSRRGRFFFWV